MSEATEDMSDTIEIDLTPDPENQETEKPDETETSDVKPKLANKVVNIKPVNELTDEERQIIINNAKAGYDQPNFDVRFFKNGKTRIVKKKAKAPTVSQKVISSTEQKPPEKKVFYSDNQLIMEHIIDLNSKYDRLMSKHKKLKRKYYNLREDIYVNDDDEPVNEKVIRDNDNVEKQESSSTEQSPPPQQPRPQYNPYGNVIPRNWRANLKYVS